MSNNTDIKATDLFCQTVDAKSRMVDWSETLGEELEGWEAFALEDCHECDREVLCSSHMGEDEHRYIEPEITVTDEDGDEEDIDNECMGHVYFEGPQMNHFYPCPDLDSESARLIAHLPLCVVVMGDGETGFALTGGGMDLSWEICDAYISCGFLPPLDYCSLPDMAGREKHPRSPLILEACRRSCEVAQGWAERKGEALARMAEAHRAKTSAA